MSRISASQRQSAAKRLIDAYRHLCGPSGQVRVKSLAFSPHPRAWSIIAETTAGPVFGRGYRTCDVELTATVSRLWLSQSWTTLINAEKLQYALIAGASPLPPPGDDVSLLQFLSFTGPPEDSKSRLRLTPRWGFQFAFNGIDLICGIHTHPPARMDRAIAAAHQEFRQHLAVHVARRLNPAPANEGRPLILMRSRHIKVP